MSRENSGRKTGRPRKSEPPRIPYDELDRVLVHGEEVACEDGETKTVVYPSYRELAARHGVSHSLIAKYSRKHGCMKRRKEAKARVVVQVDQKLTELRAEELAISKDDTLRMIDSYFAGFNQALRDGRVRFDNPSDFNTMVRLREFIQGGADSRPELHASITLDELQRRHRELLRDPLMASVKARGESPDESVQKVHAKSPPPPTEDPPQEVHTSPQASPPEGASTAPAGARSSSPDADAQGGSS